MRPALLVLPLALVQGPAIDSPPRAAAFLEVRGGSLPLVLSAPHGGSEKPAAAPDRTSGVTTLDIGTRELALAVADELERLLDARPFVVTTSIHRSKVDLNRPADDATDAEGLGAEVWREYHAALEGATAAARKLRDGRALVIDLHGHAHDEPLVELGFALDAKQLALDDAALARERWFDEERVDVPWVRGGQSLGARLAEAGLAAVPSPLRPHPDGKPYFNGGYIVRRHRDANLRAVQLEFPAGARSRERRAETAKQVARALAQVLSDWYPAPAPSGDAARANQPRK